MTTTIIKKHLVISLDEQYAIVNALAFLWCVSQSTTRCRWTWAIQACISKKMIVVRVSLIS